MKESLLYPVTLPENTKDFPLYFDGYNTFFRKDEIEIKPGGSLIFKAPFNVLSTQQWSEYTELSEIRIRVTIEGYGTIKLIVQNDETEEIVKEEVFSCNKKKEIVYDIVLDQYEKSILYISINASKDCFFHGGGFFTEQKPNNSPKLGFVICTYQREQSLNFLRGQLQESIDYNSLNDSKIFIVDNGNTLPTVNYEKNCMIIPNRNLGGAGGFTRGIIEAKKDSSLTHIVLMDDDIELPLTSMCIFISTLRYLKKIHKNQMIPSAMYSHANRTRQTTWLENTFIGKNINICSNEDVLIMLSDYDKIYGKLEESHVTCSWWLCSIPIEYMNDAGLPLPYFIKWDDAEYSMRSKSVFKPLLLFGFSVWHMDFNEKMSLSINYYRERNRIYTSFFHNKRIIKGELRIFLSIIKSILLKKDVKSRVYVLKVAYTDILKGSDWFINHDRIKLHNKLFKNDMNMRFRSLFSGYVINLIHFVFKYNRLSKQFLTIYDYVKSDEFWLQQLK